MKYYKVKVKNVKYIAISINGNGMKIRPPTKHLSRVMRKHDFFVNAKTKVNISSAVNAQRFIAFIPIHR